MRLIDADALFNWGKFKLSDAVKYGNKAHGQQDFSYSTLMMYEIADEIDAAPTIDAADLIESLTAQLAEMTKRREIALTIAKGNKELLESAESQLTDKTALLEAAIVAQETLQKALAESQRRKEKTNGKYKSRHQ